VGHGGQRFEHGHPARGRPQSGCAQRGVDSGFHTPTISLILIYSKYYFESFTKSDDSPHRTVVSAG
jgi:hypothetical protein